MTVRSLTMPLPPHYRSAPILAYHGRDALSVSERVAAQAITKPIQLDGRTGRLVIHLADANDPIAPVARISLGDSLADADPGSVEPMVGRMLGLQSEPLVFEAMPATAALVGDRAGLRIPLTATAWEAVCWAIIGQQINLTFAAALRRALIERVGRLDPASGLYVHPEPGDVAALNPAELAGLRFSRSKASYLVGIAQLIASGALRLDQLHDLAQPDAEAALCAIRGVGQWTARYIMLRGLGMPDIAPIGDSGLAAALQRLLVLPARPDIKAQEAAMSTFAPHRSLATAHLWASLAAS